MAVTTQTTDDIFYTHPAYRRQDDVERDTGENYAPDVVNFVIRDGKIVCQTIHYTVQAKTP